MGLLIQILIALPFGLIGGLLIVVGRSDDRSGRPRRPSPSSPSTCSARSSAGMITAPFLAGVLALLYIDRRMRAEGLDFVLRRQERTARPAPPCRLGGGAMTVTGIAAQLAAAAPVGRDEARRAAERELSKGIYHQNEPGPVDARRSTR